MVEFEFNEAALQKAVEDGLAKAMAQIDRDMGSYRGKPVAEVEPALERSMRRHGVEPDTRSKDFQRMAEVISGGGHLR